ncbi:hypothetical protein [Polluticaenibacter yanchengensis]|uniref:Uncharacterized protein n=1 Tax=Polluticaenibacter yanchengensis TaxID=3014562 RepID=A0ABT4UHJ9_9BACT|nr:hypothetical protein [Chitinophagaceae bacterium LY-5]
MLNGCGGQQAGAPCAWYEPLKVSEPDEYFGEYVTLQYAGQMLL